MKMMNCIHVPDLIPTLQCSGLDDYPRASPLHPSELHVDLLSWMGFYSSCLKMIATKIGRADDAKELEEYAENVWLSLQDLHWDSNSKTFCDLTIDKRSKSVKLVHKGYISIFPFILRLLPADSEYLDATLDLISDETELWSDYGLASLSKSDPLYGSNEVYNSQDRERNCLCVRIMKLI